MINSVECLAIVDQYAPHIGVSFELYLLYVFTVIFFVIKKNDDARSVCGS